MISTLSYYDFSELLSPPSGTRKCKSYIYIFFIFHMKWILSFGTGICGTSPQRGLVHVQVLFKNKPISWWIYWWIWIFAGSKQMAIYWNTGNILKHLFNYVLNSSQETIPILLKLKALLALLRLKISHK